MVLTSIAPLPRQCIGSALRLYRKAAGFTLEEVAYTTGINHGTISKIETGKQEFSQETIAKIAAAIRVPLAEIYRRAEATARASAPPAAPPPDIPDLEPVALPTTVPLISWVAAGSWSEAIDTLAPGQGARIPTTARVRQHTYALRVRGDSMEPKFPDGSIIIVEPEEEPLPGKYVIVRQNGDTEVVFKQLIQDGGTLYLKPLNDRYPILALRTDAVFCGVVKRVEMDV